MDYKEIAKVELKQALIMLREAWVNCEDAIGNIFIEDVNNYIIGTEEDGSDKYPFVWSFEESNVIAWIDGCIKRIESQAE